MDAVGASASGNAITSISAEQQPESALHVLQNALQHQLSIRSSARVLLSAAAGATAVPSTPQPAGRTQDQTVSSILRNISQLTHTASSTQQQPSSDATPSTATGDESAAAAAERHRLESTQTLDLQSVAKWVEGMLPYIIILAAVFVYHYCTGIFLFIWLLCSLIKANQLMRKLVAQKRDYQPGEVVAALLYIATNVAVVCWLTSGQGLHRMFLLKPPASPVTVWQAAFMVLIADSLVRFCGLAPKLLVVAAVKSCCSGGTACSKSSRRQARLLTLLEYLVSGYRALVPIPVWYTYLVTCTLNSVLCSLLAGFYLSFKGYGLLQQGQLVIVASKLVMRSASGALVGTYLGKAEAGDACCPICQEPADAAVKLDCSHVYCEDCISEWLERDKAATCPMCRTHIQPPGLQSFGDGATSLLPQLF